MNAATLATVLPLAIGVALSPVAIIQLILILFSTKRVVNGIVFVVMLWTLSGAVLALGFLGSQAAGDTSGGRSLAVSIVLAALGLFLLFLGLKNWAARRVTTEPAIFAKISTMGPGAVAVLALGVVVLNPKSLPLVLGAGQSLGNAANPLLMGLIFLFVAMLPCTGSLIYSLFGGVKAANRLEKLRVWLIRYNRAIMGIVCIVLGIFMTATGVLGML